MCEDRITMSLDRYEDLMERNCEYDFVIDNIDYIIDKAQLGTDEDLLFDYDEIRSLFRRVCKYKYNNKMSELKLEKLENKEEE